ncbi:MAG: hypothetical protein ABIP51_15025 [Bacteroidia bacterium]
MKNKKTKKDLTFLKYKKRVKRFAANCSHYITKDGRDIFNPKTIDIIKDKGYLEYKNSSVLCSCYDCSGYYKYKRHLKKAEDLKLIKEDFHI